MELKCRSISMPILLKDLHKLNRNCQAKSIETVKQKVPHCGSWSDFVGSGDCLPIY
jgi:hypothetical protein